MDRARHPAHGRCRLAGHAGAVLTTLILFVIVYGIVFSMGIYYINRLIENGPKGAAAATPDGVPSRPLSAAEQAAHDAIEGT